jgi:hypothetical protein
VASWRLKRHRDTGIRRLLLLQGLEVVNCVPYFLLGHLSAKGGHGRAGDPGADDLEQVVVRMERYIYN